MSKLAFIGCGNMGEAILRGVLAAGRFTAGEIVVIEALEERRRYLAVETGVAAVADIAAVEAADVWLLAVKPQQMADALVPLARALAKAPALVLSIAAGVATARLAEGLGPNARLVRAMPNTPMLAGCGCTGICPGPGATEADMDVAEAVFASAGSVVRVAESDMDAVTAVSGSGPAYFFYLIEAMVAAGAAEGLDEATALALATKTCEGAAKLLDQSGLDPAELRRRVTSPGGTTQAAIESMEAAGVGKALVAGVRAAAARGRELSK